MKGTVTQSASEIRECPTCDYRGKAETCPVDGTRTRMIEGPVGGNTDSPEARAPTLAGRMSGADSAPSARSLSLEPSASIPPEDMGDDASLRSEDYGQWAAPEVSQHSSSIIGRSVGGRYVITGTLGRGGMGTVYLADQPSVQRTVAIKVLHREYAENPSIVRRFHQEAMAASRLNHPHTISVYDFGQSDGLLYIAMEHLRGQTLHEVTQSLGGLTVERSLLVMRQVLKSVGEAHLQGIIHRDLKPENIFLTQVEGEVDFVKVLDFGVAKLKQPDEAQATLTQAGTVFGTPRYMAPEQSRDVLLDHRADLYALGVILYEMLMGRVPFDSDNPLGVMLAHSSVVPPRFSESRPDLEVPEALESVVFKSLAKDPKHRYQNAAEMAADVDVLIAAVRAGDIQSSAHELPDIRSALIAAGAERTSVDDAWTDTMSQPETRTSRASGRSGLLWTLALAAVVVAAMLWFSRQPVTPSAVSSDLANEAPNALTPVSAVHASDAALPDVALPRADAAPQPAKRVRRPTPREQPIRSRAESFPKKAIGLPIDSPPKSPETPSRIQAPAPNDEEIPSELL